ncbi:FHA domain-containing protein [Puerhibacterium sp. TATVAM-FAB25]|uniref:FHA domain-containing protein n=1 Tax=Puerhibacterium sp. TATVAM-FAB25 TaxID=3093699 RepID=UPI00397D926E
MGVRYAIGSGRAVVRGDVVVVLPQPPEPGVLDRLWEALDPAPGAEPGVMDALQVLTDGVGGLHRVPPFAVAAVRDGVAHVLVRGDCRVELESGDGGAVTVDGAGVATWSERTVRDVVGLSVRADGGSGLLPVQGTWPLAGGVVAAGAVGVRLALAARPDEAGAPAVGAVPTTPAAPVEPAVPVEPVEPVELLQLLRATAAAGDADASPDTLLPDHSTVGVVAAPAAPDDGIATAAVAAAVEAPVPAAAEPVPAEPVPTGPVQVEPDEETYGHLWGQTVMRGVEAAAVRPDEEDEDASGDAPAAAAADVAPSTPSFAPPPSDREPDLDPAAVRDPVIPAPGAAPAAAPGACLPEPPPGILAGVPKVWDASPVPPPAPAVAPGPAPTPAPVPAAPAAPPVAPAPQAPVGDLDHDGNTVLSSAVADLRAAAGLGAAPARGSAPGAPADRPAGPQILARTCPQGHPNPPSWERCRTCQAELTGDAALAPRPLLGRMRTSAGEVVDLDRTVVVGRRPRAPRTSGGDGARLVTVDSPSQDISRSHVEVRLEGWHVLVSDMATTNGTTLLRPGQPPRRLHPSEGVLVADGDVVDLGDGVTLGFEEIW